MVNIYLTELHLKYGSYNIIHISVIDNLNISCDFALKWMPEDLTEDQPTLAQVMAWCC